MHKSYIICSCPVVEMEYGGPGRRPVEYVSHDNRNTWGNKNIALLGEGTLEERYKAMVLINTIYTCSSFQRPGSLWLTDYYNQADLQHVLTVPKLVNLHQNSIHSCCSGTCYSYTSQACFVESENRFSDPLKKSSNGWMEHKGRKKLNFPFFKDKFSRFSNVLYQMFLNQKCSLFNKKWTWTQKK